MTAPDKADVFIWNEGKQYLSRNGLSIDRAGSVIGKWRKTYHTEDVRHALEAALNHRPSHPVEYITKILAGRQERNIAPESDRPDDKLLRTITFLQERVDRLGIGRHGLELALQEARKRGLAV